MSKTYVETPYNFDEIKEYIICDKKKAADEILVADICFIYDTCAIWSHAKISDITPLVTYIKGRNGVVIITRTVLMEMCSDDSKIWTQHIDFIKKLSDAGIKVLVFNEEDSLECLKRVYAGSVGYFNNLLKYALRIARKWKGTVDEVIANSGSDMIRKLSFTFFKMARANKKPQDNLAEELFIICAAILSNTPSINKYKYIVISEDRGLIRKLVEMTDNLKKHTGARRCSMLTTPGLCQVLIKEGLINTPDELQNILNCAYQDKKIKVCCSEEYDLKPKEKDYTKEELGDKLLNDSNFTVYY